MGSGVVKGAGTFLSFAVTFALARNLGPTGYGVYAYVLALVMTLTIPAQFGLPELVVRETARAHNGSDWAALKGIWRWGTIAAGVFAMVIGVAASGGAWLLSDRISDINLATFSWGIVLIPVLALVRLRSAALRGARHVLAGQIPDTLIRPGLLVVFVAVCGLTGEALTADVAMALHVLAGALAFATSMIVLERVGPREVGFAKPRFKHGLWIRALFPLGMAASTTLINKQADILLLGFFVESGHVGMYRVGVQGAMLVAFGIQTVNMVAAPQFTRLHNMGDRSGLQQLTRQCARISLAAALPASLTLIFFGEDLLRLIFGSEYVGAATVLAILSVGQLVNASMGSVGMLLAMSDHEKVVTKTLGVAAIVNIVANLILIPIWGMNGAALATTGAMILWNGLLARSVWVHLGINSTAFA